MSRQYSTTETLQGNSISKDRKENVWFTSGITAI